MKFREKIKFSNYEDVSLPELSRRTEVPQWIIKHWVLHRYGGGAMQRNRPCDICYSLDRVDGTIWDLKYMEHCKNEYNESMKNGEKISHQAAEYDKKEYSKRKKRVKELEYPKWKKPWEVRLSSKDKRNSAKKYRVHTVCWLPQTLTDRNNASNNLPYYSKNKTLISQMQECIKNGMTEYEMSLTLPNMQPYVVFVCTCSRLFVAHGIYGFGGPHGWLASNNSYTNYRCAKCGSSTVCWLDKGQVKKKYNKASKEIDMYLRQLFGGKKIKPLFAGTYQSDFTNQKIQDLIIAPCEEGQKKLQYEKLFELDVTIP